MSVILITHHDENIYNIVATSDGEYEANSPTFKARRRRRLPPAYNRNIKGFATMGLPEEPLPDPKNFLKKRTGKLCHPSEKELKAALHKHDNVKKSEPVPTKDTVKVYDQRRKEEAKIEKKFITENIKKVLKMKPKEPEQKVVIERYGETKHLTDGLEPIYIHADVMGKIPRYLENFIKKAEKVRQMQKDSSGVEKPKCQYITRDEREKLLIGLKHNWEELQKQYQGLPILTDTIPKINRKAKLEAELKQLEKDIVLIERHPYIYVYEENNV